jgi:hypothetical protein
MPYLRCSRCSLTVHSLVAYAMVDRCPRCHGGLEPAAKLSQVRELQRAFASRDKLMPSGRPKGAGATPRLQQN